MFLNFLMVLACEAAVFTPVYKPNAFHRKILQFYVESLWKTKAHISFQWLYHTSLSTGLIKCLGHLLS